MLPPSDDHIYLIDLEIVDYPGKALNSRTCRIQGAGDGDHAAGRREFGVISDIDDTVLRSDVTDILSLMRNTFLENAHTRLPFEGVAELYQALRRGGSRRTSTQSSTSPAARGICTTCCTTS
ncbi:MAG: phosphatase domain-containing protein [Anaerolineae bacterium]